MANRDKSIEVRHDTVPSEMMKHRKDAIKFGIRTPLRETDKGELVFLGPEQPISDAVKFACEAWGYLDPSIFALKFTEPPCHYVTDDRRAELSGKLLTMNYSPAKVCTDIIGKLKGNNEKDLQEALKELSSNASDPTVANAFVALDGLDHLMALIKDALADWAELGLRNALQSLLDIMMLSDDGSWDKMRPPVISKICSYVRGDKGGRKGDISAMALALQVLENAVSLGSAYLHVEKELTVDNLVHLVQNVDPKVQQNALALINALFSKADSIKREEFGTSLASCLCRENIHRFIIQKKHGDRLSETNHELYVMQTLLLNLLEGRMLTPINPNDQEALSKISNLFAVVFDSDSSINFEANNPSTGTKRDKSNQKRDYQKLGFTNNNSPVLDFAGTPPGALALDCMYYFAMYHPESYSKIILESSCRYGRDQCPFAKSSIALTNVLCEVLKIGDSPNDQQEKFYPFLFQHEQAFEELYCICAQLVAKTWKEMKATDEDFDKVIDVVDEQIRRTLDKIPDTFKDFKKYLNALTYQEITKLRQKERNNREEVELQTKPVQELRRKLVPEMMELIKQNRLNYLIAGTRFHKFTSRGLNLTRMKEKFWFCRLSPNGKIFYYGDCDEKATPVSEELSNKLNVTDVKDILLGKDCPHMKDPKKKGNIPLAFSLLTDQENMSTVDFIAPDEDTYNMWTDGINALLGKEMVSKEARKDLDILLHMEIKLRLLDLEGILNLPQEPPEIPELPTNFDFAGLRVHGGYVK